MTQKHFLPYAALLIFLSSCSHAYYSPNTANVPVFKEKNEFKASASAALSQVSGGDFQAAYAPTRCIGVLANANVNGYGNIPTSGGRGYLIELGAGYFRPLHVNTKHAENVIVFEAYGLVGLGGSKGFYWNNSGVVPTTNIFGQRDSQQFFYPYNCITMQYFKAYAQPSISFSHNVVDLIFAAKIGFLYTYKFNSTIPGLTGASVSPDQGQFQLGTPYSDYQTLIYNRVPFLFEPSFTIRLGFKWVKFQGQICYSVTRNQFMQNVAGLPFLTSIGVSVDISHRFKKQPPHPSGNEIDY